MAFKNGYRLWDDEYKREHWTPQEIAESEARVARISEIIDAEHNGEISHDEAMIRHLMLDFDLAENMLDDAYGNKEATRKVKYYIKEAKRRTRQIKYWNSLVNNAEQTAQSGYNLDNVIALVSKALGILKAAVQ